VLFTAKKKNYKLVYQEHLAPNTKNNLAPISLPSTQVSTSKHN